MKQNKKTVPYKAIISLIFMMSMIFFIVILPALGGHDHRGCIDGKAKSSLKQMGTAVAIYFSDGRSAIYPEDLEILFGEEEEGQRSMYYHPRNRDAKPSWEEIEKGHASYLLLCKSGSAYTGNPTYPIAMEQPGLWEEYPSRVFVVYEDGHVGSIEATNIPEALRVLKEQRNDKWEMHDCQKAH